MVGMGWEGGGGGRNGGFPFVEPPPPPPPFLACLPLLAMPHLVKDHHVSLLD